MNDQRFPVTGSDRGGAPGGGRRMRSHGRITIKGLLGLIIGLAGCAYLAVNHARAQAPTAQQAQPQAPAPPPPSEQINVEQIIAFPYDI